MQYNEETVINPMGVKGGEMSVKTYTDRLFGKFTAEDIGLLVRQQVALRKLRSPEHYQYILAKVGEANGVNGLTYERTWEGAIVGIDNAGRRWVVCGSFVGTVYGVRSFIKQHRRGKNMQWMINGQPLRNCHTVQHYAGELRIAHPEVTEADLTCAMNVTAVN